MDIFKQQRKIDFQIICLNFLLLAKLELVKVVYCITSSKVNVSEILEFFFLMKVSVNVVIKCN